MANTSNILIYGVGGTLLAGIIMWIMRWVGSKTATQTITDLLNKNLETKIEETENISKEQQILLNQLKVADKTSDQTKQKINTILSEASNELNIVLKEDNIKKIDDQIKNDWKDL